MTTRIENKQSAGEVETRKPIMLMNGKPIYASADPVGPISEQEVEALAEFVTDNADVAAAWMSRPNPRLRNRTPRQAVAAGDGQEAANILRSFITL